MRKNIILSAAIVAVFLLSGCTKTNQNQPVESLEKTGGQATDNGKLVWLKTFGGRGIEIAKDIVASPDGGYVIAGSTTSAGSGASDAYLVRIDEQGNVVWDKTYGGSGDDAVYSVVPSAGGYVACGRKDVSTVKDKKNFDLYVIKTDKDGKLVWEKTFGGNEMEEGNGLAATADNGYIVAGMTGSKGNGNGDVWVVKLSKDGNIEWDRTFGGKARDYGNSVIQTPEGGFVVAGNSGEKNKIYIIALDPTGKPLWEKYYGSGNADIAGSIIRNRDGSFVVCGMTQATPNTKVDAMLLKISNTGDIVWQTIVSTESFSSAVSVRELSDGSFITCGTKSASDASKGGAYVYILTFDSKGKNTGTKIFGGTDIDYGNAIVSTPDGRFVFAGYTGYTGKDKAGNFDILYGKF
jgi:hypothetical protein